MSRADGRNKAGGVSVRILIVEDCALDAELAAHEIRRQGLTIVTLVVDTSEAFLAALAEFKPDLILSDYRLPHFDGMAALRLAQKYAPSTPLLISTGSMNEEIAVACMKAGAWDYILKENLTRLGLAVRAALERKRDLAEKALAERSLAESERRYRKLSAHLQRVRERERTVIAREIHDELGQSLTALKIDLSLLRPDAEGFEARRREMSGLIDQTLGTVQRLTAELRPGVLDDLGLEAAVEWQVNTFKTRTGIAGTFTSEGRPGALDRDRSTAMFRILQEALTNVARHAAAACVTVTLHQDKKGASLVVRDDGRGLPTAELGNPRSYGLIGMQERAAEFGGHVEFQPTPGGGTVVLAHIPTSAGLEERRRTMSGLIDRAIGTVQQITAELRPGVLDELGLEAAAEWQVNTFKAHIGIASTFTAEGLAGALDRDRSTAMFRILQKALTNVVRHASAAHVAVVLRQDEQGASLEIRDDGRGLPAAELDNPHSSGLIGMQERAAEFGGHVEFQPASGGGTVVLAHMPKERRRNSP